jgi:tellurite methyltransferase
MLFFLARHGFRVVAMDLSNEAIKQNNTHTEQYDNVSFYCGDVSKQEDVALLLDKARIISNTNNIVVYSRFFFHSLSENQEDIFLEKLSKELIKNDKIYFEFRVTKDSGVKKIYENHFRRFINSDIFSKKLSKYRDL